MSIKKGCDNQKILININYLSIFQDLCFSTDKEKSYIDFAWQPSR